jgi:nitroreductase
MIHDIILNRWSPYSYSSKKIEENVLQSLFDAAGKAPSSNNEQPWLFVHATKENRESFDALIGCLMDNNKVWAENAYVIAVSLARLNSSYNGKPNKYAFHDTGMAVATLLFQAASVGLYVHQMGGFFVDRVEEYLDLKEGIEPVAMMVIGYPGDGTGIPVEFASRDNARRGRKDPSEYSFTERLPQHFVRESKK